MVAFWHVSFNLWKNLHEVLSDKKKLNFLIRDLSGEFKVTPQARRCVLIISRIISDNFYASPLTVTCQLKPTCLIKNQKIQICQFLLKQVGFNWQATVIVDA